MSHGNRYKYSNTQKRQADYIKESYKEKGLSDEAAERVARVTVNKDTSLRKKEWLRLQEEELLRLQEEEKLITKFRFLLDQNGS